jgi:hypothetical protein
VVLRYCGRTVLDERTYTQGKKAMTMGFYIGGGLPGPFSWSMRVTPRMPKMPRQRRPASRSSCSCPHPRPKTRYYTQPPTPRALPQDHAVERAEMGKGDAIRMWLTVIAVIVLLFLGAGGLRL